MTDPRLVTAARVDEDAQYEAGLRPRRLDEYIGQDRIRENLQVAITAAKQRGEPLDHVLLHGPPGLGKTTLAYVIANEMGVPVRATSGPAIEKPGDLVGIVTNLAPGEVLFIDEIHRMSPAIEEILYPALEDYEVDIVIGQGPSARTVKMRLEPFTLDRRDDADRAAHVAAAIALRDLAPPRVLHRRPISRRSCAGRRRFWTCRSTMTPPPRSPGARAARRASSTGCCAGCATTRRCGPAAGSRARWPTPA